EGEEGKYYRWDKQELGELSKSVAGYEAAAKVFRLDGRANFEGEFHVPDPGQSLTAVAEKQNKTFAELIEKIAPARQALLQARQKHARPITDTKILTAWNGLMVAGLADAGRLLERPDYTEAAATAANFLLEHLRDEEGRLWRSYAAEEAKFNGYVDDYAFLVSGLIALHRASGEQRWLDLAKEITDKQIELFWDQGNGGFFFTSVDHDALIVRVKDPVDSALPSGASVSGENLRYLAPHFADAGYQDRAAQTLQGMIPLFQQTPAGVPRTAAVLAGWLDEQSTVAAE
ncbi:MAG: thioredoxin domain-containing protein, partial [Pirellulales bacterium]|nr:thioredoxin domain-containing protein [Pirellulales bacterium]